MESNNTGVEIKSFKGFERFKGSIRPKDLLDLSIKSQELIKNDKKHYLLSSGGQEKELIKVITNCDKILFIVYSVGWGGDDVDECYHAFDKLEVAEICYGFYMSEMPTDELFKVETFNVIISKSESETIIKPFSFFKNYIVFANYGGDLLRPIWNTRLLEKNGWYDMVKSIDSDSDIRDFIDTKYEIALLRIGENPEGYNVDYEKVIYPISHYCWETGRTFYEVKGLPKDIFAKIKPSLTFHSEEEEEEGDWKGWYFFHQEKHKVQDLLPNGWSISNNE